MLLGHPLAQISIIKNDTNFLEGADTATDNMVVQFKKDMGGSGSADISLNTVAMNANDSSDTGGVDGSGMPQGNADVAQGRWEANPIFKSILEQMLAGGNDLKSRFENAPTDVSDNSVNTMFIVYH